MNSVWSVLLQDREDELFDDDLEVEIKEEVLDDEMLETAEAYHVEPTVQTTKDPDMILPDPRPSTSYISVTPLHKVDLSESINPNTRLVDMDEFHLFGMNVASQLRTLPLHDALQAQLKIQTILTKIRSRSLSWGVCPLTRGGGIALPTLYGGGSGRLRDEDSLKLCNSWACH